jgi:hypothetical protein
MHFLVVDDRYGTPIHVFMELDPRDETGFPGFRVRAVTLEPSAAPSRAGLGVHPDVAVGCDPGQLDRFREFRTDGAVAGAGFILIEPRYVGPSWPSYILAFRPAGEKPVKRSRLPVPVARDAH